jgi:putative copper export protein
VVLAAIAKLLLYGGVTLVAGEITLGSLAAGAPSTRYAERARSTARAGWIALCVGVVVMLIAEARELELEYSADAFGVLLGTRWGSAWEFVAVSVLVGALVFAMRRGAWARPLLVGCVAAGLGGLGHAAADDAWPLASRVLDALHVMCVSGWIGGLYLLARLDASDTPDDAWARFSRAATVLAPVVLLSGVLASLLRLRAATLPAVLESAYGRLLLLKVLLALVVLSLGALHRKHILTGDRPRASSIRFELAVAALVFIVTGVLTGTATPGE